MPSDYVITVRGHLDDHWADWFDGMTITNGPDGAAALAGPVADQAALHGLLMKIRDLGLPLIAVVPAGASDGAAGKELDEAELMGDRLVGASRGEQPQHLQHRCVSCRADEVLSYVW